MAGLVPAISVSEGTPRLSRSPEQPSPLMAARPAMTRRVRHARLPAMFSSALFHWATLSAMILVDFVASSLSRA